MAFTAFPGQKRVVDLLQRSLGLGRLAHAYLFKGHQISELEALARTLIKTLNCLQPVRSTPDGPAIDCCDVCASCRKIDGHIHADVHWVRPESKSRIVKVEQMRDLMREMFLKPNEAQYKAAVIVSADRMGPQAANAFLKTLEEPPPRSILILLTTAPERILETITSRCLRLNFAGEGGWRPSPAQMEWLASFGEMAAQEQKSLMTRYRLLGVLTKKLGELRAEIEKALTARSPLERYDEVDADLREKWEDELAAAIEAEYRLQRSDVLASLEWWLRDVWLRTMSLDGRLLTFPDLPSTARVAGRVSASKALENLSVLGRTQRLLGSNVQEALALEVGLLKLNL